uniref:Integrase catalytic domain-containing protein n=1 Tax=Myripristis murdjan TaxID=586833 RepID=A0A667ZMH0_9TELE
MDLSRDPDTFFTLFERVSEARQWPDGDKVLLLQCVLTGKAQEAYSTVCAQEGLTYETVKSAVLKAYELVPEAYRQRFRHWVKSDKQTNVEFVRDLTTHFHRWCAAEKVNTFDGLCQLIIMEQFKNVAPQRVAAYLNEREPATALRAAELADDFLLTHRSGFAGVRERVGDDSSFTRGRFSKSGLARGASASVRPGRSNLCNFCHGEGHWKDQCPLLRRKSGAPSPAPAMLCASAPVEKAVEVGDGDRSGFEPFIIDAQVSLVGSAEYVNIRVLRDTGARHSFIVQSALPFSADTQSGDFIVMRGMELGFVPVPRHNVLLDCDLAKGVFSVGVRPELPLPGVSMILGNDICGGRVWPSGPPPPVVVSEPAVVKALSQFISVFGIPKVIQSDRGSNFCSHMFAQVLKMLGVSHNQSTPYHAQSQGALERFHQTLKSLLRAYCTELDRDWEDGLPWLMLAAREAVQESTGFSPNEL